MKEKISILYCEDEKLIAEIVIDRVKKNHPQASISHYQYVYEAIEILKSQSFDLVISDNDMVPPNGPNYSGVYLFKHMRENGLTSPFILMTGTVLTKEIILLINNYSNFAYVPKPISFDLLKQNINVLLSNNLNKRNTNDGL